MKNTITVESLKPRNFLVAHAIKRKAGSHQKSEKAKRKLANQSLDKMVNFDSSL